MDLMQLTEWNLINSKFSEKNDDNIHNRNNNLYHIYCCKQRQFNFRKK
jgi:hypothetical protein